MQCYKSFLCIFHIHACPSEMMQVRDFLLSPALQLLCCRSNTGDTLVVTNELNYLQGPPFPLQPILWPEVRI